MHYITVNTPLYALYYCKYTFVRILLLSIHLCMHYITVNTPLYALYHCQYTFVCIILLSINLCMHYITVNRPLYALYYCQYTFVCIILLSINLSFSLIFHCILFYSSLETLFRLNMFDSILLPGKCNKKLELK